MENKKTNNQYKMFQYIGETLEQCKDYATQDDFIDAIVTFKENISLCGIKGKEYYESVELENYILNLSTYEVRVGLYHIRFRAVEYTIKG